MTKADFGWHYPPGVTGNEYAIAGPDYEDDSDIPCPECGAPCIEQSYSNTAWLICINEHQAGLDPCDGCGKMQCVCDVLYDRRKDEGF